MAASSSASAKYDVFISFRGENVRSGFLSHLEKELRSKSIDVYVDEMLKKGEEISSSLMRAIEESMIALVIFSKDYASSRWCLEELGKIMEGKEATQQRIVIPVFYNVDPTDVRKQKGTYEEAFNLHKDKFSDKVVETWRSVLQKSANLSGHVSSTFKNESELVQAIVQDISKQLGDNSSIVPKEEEEEEEEEEIFDSEEEEEEEEEEEIFDSESEEEIFDSEEESEEEEEIFDSEEEDVIFVPRITYLPAKTRGGQLIYDSGFEYDSEFEFELESERSWERSK